MNKVSPKIPSVTYLYILSCAYKIFNLVVTLVRASQNNIENLNIMSLILSVAIDVVVIVLLFRNKKDITLFAVFSIISARTIISSITNFSIWGILSCVASLLLVFIVGTVTLPKLSEYQSRAKKLFFVPAIIILAVSILSNIGILQYFTLCLPVFTFMLFIMPFATNFFFALWCVKSQEEISVDNKKEKMIFKIVAILLIVSVVLSICMAFGQKSQSASDSTSEIYDDNDNGRYDPEDVFGKNYGGWIDFAESLD